ncbi:hypothetical protein CYY_002638 [Polysphondylium violaceum]|uniref:Uncharacterized protein n=1 Tax=Polysphondylium violaceum TaxID=133409 RepID=A0A8J4Q1D4_9MYCE|nr:hypothetical protein CYY_002638 [Polysphondylium violaceum]
MSDAEYSPPSVRRLTENFQGPSSTSPTNSPSVTKKTPTTTTPKQPGTFDNDTSSISKQNSAAKVERFLKEEVLPKGHAPGSAHRSALNKPAPNELDNKARDVNKFSGNSHPVYGLMLAGKQHDTSTTKKKIVIPPSSAY